MLLFIMAKNPHGSSLDGSRYFYSRLHSQLLVPIRKLATH